MAVTIRTAVYANGDDAFVAWAPSGFIAGCRGFLLERARKKPEGIVVEPVENRLGFKHDKPQSGDHRPSDFWPFQRFNWVDHDVRVGDAVRYRVTAMVDSGSGRPYSTGPSSAWSRWTTLKASAGNGFACNFNRGIALSQFVARYLQEKKLTPAKWKASLKTGVDPQFRAFLEGDLGKQLRDLLVTAGGTSKATLHAALYELDDASFESGLIGLGERLRLILANGSDRSGDGNEEARAALNAAGITTVDRLLGSRGLGHNKFAVLSNSKGPTRVWTGSTNWTTTGVCTQINNALTIDSPAVASAYRAQWDRLLAASPPALIPAAFPPELVAANDAPATFTIGKASVTVWFTRTSKGADMAALRELIASAQSSILFLMFQPGKNGLHTQIGARANEPSMYVRGVVSTLGTTAAESAQNVLDVRVVSSDRRFVPDRYSVVQPQGIDQPLGPWLAEVTRRDFLAQVGHAIVHSKVLLIDALSDDPVVVTGSHNFSDPASKSNDENLVIVRGHKALAVAYAAHVMGVYGHYRYRSYIREMLAAGKTPWSYLDDDDRWLKNELVSKSQEIAFWTAK